MTAAVCLKCGKMKVGAFSGCPQCRYIPDSDEERAKQLITTDHFIPFDQLEVISKRIAAGGPVQFDPVQVQEVMNSLRQFDAQGGQQALNGKLRRAILLFLLVFGAVVFTFLYFLSQR
jgi:hypothetical protein